MKKVLMVAFHFPPLAGSSGIQRTLRFAQHLPEFGWQPLVLTADPRAYERVSDDLNQDVPAGTVVRRAFALDTARHLSLKGRYVASWARPDRWRSWRFDAVRQGLQMVREHQPDAIWSTYPIATAHSIGAQLHRRSQLPWIADFRDPMAQDDYPPDPKTHEMFRQIEAEAIGNASASTFTTPSATLDYRKRYPAAASRIHLLENGYDEASFAQPPGGQQPSAPAALTPGAVTLLHSGIVYPSERDPTQLMQALRLLHDAGRITPQSLRLRFRAAVAEDLLRTLAAQHGVLDYLDIHGPAPYRQALQEMLAADGLLILQAANCNAQIPAKLYEYLRAGRPILALTDPAGDTAQVLGQAGIDAIAHLADAPGIAKLLGRFLSPDRQGLRVLPLAERVSQASRRGRTAELAQLLSGVTSRAGTAP